MTAAESKRIRSEKFMVTILGCRGIVAIIPRANYLTSQWIGTHTTVG